MKSGFPVCGPVSIWTNSVNDKRKDLVEREQQRESRTRLLEKMQSQFHLFRHKSHADYLEMGVGLLLWEGAISLLT